MDPGNGIGGALVAPERVMLTITGGSVNAGVQNTPVDAAGNKLSETIVQLDGVDTGVGLKDPSTISGLSADYGLFDVFTMAKGTLYFWVPESATVSVLRTADSTIYGGSVAAGKSGKLYKADPITLSANGGTKDGSGYGVSQATSLTLFAPVTVPKHYWQRILGYETTSGELIVKPDGTLVPGTTYTNSLGGWNYQGKDISLRARWVANTYKVAFKANKPGDASHDVAGAMAAESLTCGTPQTLTTNEYALAGWKFTGWNTKADGSGTGYPDGATVQNLTWKAGATVTLYAQWAPYSYRVTFDGGGGSVSMRAQTLTYDLPSKLSANTFTYAGHAFIGWSTNALGHLYTDEATVCNLGAVDTSGKPTDVTLTAFWNATGQVTISITDDGVLFDPESGASGIHLTGGGTTYDKFTKVSTGVYELPGMAAGTYDVVVDGMDTTGKQVVVSDVGTGTINLDFCTVEIDADDHAEAWIETAEGTTVSKLELVPVKSELTIGASVDTGYVFESYTAQLNDPTWNPDAETADQTVTVNGQTLIEAHPRPAVYHIVFDANGTTGSMSTQDLLYDEPQDLFENTFTRDGYVFSGWNTKQTGTGTEYADCESVSNLTTDDGGEVTLFAQWEPYHYYVHFEENGIASGKMLDQKMFFDIDQNLSDNEFARSGYHFTGWNTQADGLGISYPDGGSVRNLTTTQDETVTLYAQWELDTYTVLFEPNGGNGSTLRQSIPTDMATMLEANHFKSAGYTFAAWNTAADGTGTPYADSATVQHLAATGKSIELYAQWTPDTDTPYTVEHYKASEDGSYSSVPDETESLTGTTGKLTAATAKTYPGFTAQAFSQQTIAGDGSTVVSIHYVRDAATATSTSTSTSQGSTLPYTGDPGLSPAVLFGLLIVGAGLLYTATRKRS